MVKVIERALQSKPSLGKHSIDAMVRILVAETGTTLKALHHWLTRIGDFAAAYSEKTGSVHLDCKGELDPGEAAMSSVAGLREATQMGYVDFDEQY
ncbi:hypothetical protein KBY66_00305 [Synechococcus sp. Tobar12-5m-g]|uniref:hypothetical protein n=1 Tax=unclassified Synechococcus TaxID=2626047 RepID=UPI0020CFB39D|nr:MULTISPECIES: hypothetical protein [unclassified Synechococcus]MCP9771076.1 hypothetical protein [Synechococcus sp. Tobar12-5m-g]MCP9872016.1 hypothetical protein [Synechococcus sp. Cruz CV-v-12]